MLTCEPYSPIFSSVQNTKEKWLSCWFCISLPYTNFARQKLMSSCRMVSFICIFIANAFFLEKKACDEVVKRQILKYPRFSTYQLCTRPTLFTNPLMKWRKRIAMLIPVYGKLFNTFNICVFSLKVSILIHR